MKPALVAKFKKLEGRRLGEFTFIVWAAGTLYVAYLIAGYFFLIYIYGYSRVRGDDLYFVTMPKAKAWIVSNGDRITTGHFIHFLMTLGLWWSLFLATFPLIWRVLPAPKNEKKA